MEPEWIQKYESYDDIIRKFCFANEITPTYFDKIFSTESQQKRFEKIIGFSKAEYTDFQKKLVFSRIGTHINGERVFRNEEWICNKCYAEGQHSIFHQISIFTNCIYHKKERLVINGYQNRSATKWNKFKSNLDEEGERPINEIFKKWSNNQIVKSPPFQLFISIPEIFDVKPALTVFKRNNIEIEGDLNLNDDNNGRRAKL